MHLTQGSGAASERRIPTAEVTSEASTSGLAVRMHRRVPEALIVPGACGLVRMALHSHRMKEGRLVGAMAEVPSDPPRGVHFFCRTLDPGSR